MVSGKWPEGSAACSVRVGTELTCKGTIKMWVGATCARELEARDTHGQDGRATGQLAKEGTIKTLSAPWASLFPNPSRLFISTHRASRAKPSILTHLEA